MYLQKFPDIHWLRSNAAQNFSRAKDLRGNNLTSKGWPNVILNTRTDHTERDNIVGPFSLFFNLSGQSNVRVDNRWLNVSDNFYCISNKGQSYDLHVPKESSAETFNIHFGEELYNDVLKEMTCDQKTLLDYESSASAIELVPRTDLLSSSLHSQIRRFYQYGKQEGSDYSSDIEYELTANILKEILSKSLNRLAKIDSLSSQKATTRKELFRRINIAIDYMHDNRMMDIDLDMICQECGLSKFHFIRVFTELYGITPTNYMSKLKLQKALYHLEENKLNMLEIALLLGFSELSAFSRFIKRQTGQTASSFRV